MHVGINKRFNWKVIFLSRASDCSFLALKNTILPGAALSVEVCHQPWWAVTWWKGTADIERGRKGYDSVCYSKDILCERAEGFINSSWIVQLSCHLSSVSKSAAEFKRANAASDLTLTIPGRLQFSILWTAINQNPHGGCKCLVAAYQLILYSENCNWNSI